MGNCLSSSSNVAQRDAGSALKAQEEVVSAADVVKGSAAAVPAVSEPLPEPVKPQRVQAPDNKKHEEEELQLACPGEVPNAVVNPETDLILNMLDPENGPAAGMAYQVHYLGPPRPPCEQERLATVELLGKVNDSLGPDPEISCILKLVANVFKCPAALCALFDSKRVFISEQEGDVIPCGTFPWRWTLCGWSMAFKNPQVLVIQDTLQDARFSNNEKVTVFPKVRFYCGAPLVASNGHRLGTLCFADVKPRKFDMASCVMMNNLSELVVRQLEKDIAIKIKEKANKQLLDTFRNLQRAVDCYDHCVVLLDTSEDGWKVMYANAAWTKQTGMSRDQLVGSALRDVLEGTDGTQLPSPALLKAAKDLKGAKVALARVRDTSITKTFALTFRPAGRQVMDDSTIPIGVPSFLSLDDGEDNVAHRFYFMTISAPGEKRSSVASSQLGGMSSLLSSYSSSSMMLLESSGGSILNAAGNNSMQGLELAHLLGRGSFGWVYYGLWYGTPVAVKIIDEDVRPSAKQLTSSKRSPMGSANEGAGGSGSGTGGGLVPHLEALMAHELRHPNIVATLKYGTYMIPCGRAPDLEDYVAGGAGGGNLNAFSSTGNSGAQALLSGSSAIGSLAQQNQQQHIESLSVTPNRDAVFSAPPAQQQGGDALASALASTAMVTAQSALGTADGAGLVASAGNSLLSSSAEEQMNAAAAEAVAVPHGWVVIDASAGAAQAADDLEEEGEDGQQGDGRGADSLKVRPDAWKHLAPTNSNKVVQSGSNQVAGSSHVSGAVIESSSSATAMAANLQSDGAAGGGKAGGVPALAMKQTWMVMEFCDRGCVQDAIDRGWLRTERDCLHSEPNWLAVVATAYDMASALQYLHAHDVVHGDLTGWNVMLSSSGAGSTLGNRGFVAKVADFGLSRCMEMRTTIQTKTYGTLSHMPPELLSQGTMSKAVDVYSFGVLLWQMYAGSRPWSGLTHAQIIVKVTQERQRLHWNDDALPPYQALAEACMAYDPQARPSFASIVETLDSLRTSLSS